MISLARHEENTNIMSFIVILPALLAAYMAITRSLPWAYVYIYIPVVFCLPHYFSWEKFPYQPTFAAFTILPLAFLFILRGLPGWKISLMDIFVLGFVLLLGYSQYQARGYSLAQNLVGQLLMVVLFPYWLTKCLVEPTGFRIDFAKIIVIVLFCIVFFLTFEMLFHPQYTLWQTILGRLFNQGWTRSIKLRWDFGRAEGPFGHSIVAGMTMIIGFRLQRWLEWSRGWSSQRGLSSKILPSARFITMVLVVGTLVPLSRGPWISAIAMSIIIFTLAMVIGFTQKPLFRYLIVVLLLVSVAIAGIGVKKMIDEIAAVKMDEAGQESHERQTIAYRFELYQTYGDVVMEKWALGWGVLGWPSEKIQWSVDNAYILIALNHGLIAVGYIIFLFLFMIIRLFIRIMQQPAAAPPESELGLTLFSFFIGDMIYMGTVSLIGITQTVLFIFFGWAESYLQRSPKATEYRGEALADNNYRNPTFQFRRVL
jgi:hypothetical protein